MQNESAFFQRAPELGNQYDQDKVLRGWLHTNLPSAVLGAIEPHLHRLGGRAVGDMLDMAGDARSHPPVHVPFDPWGRRIDHIETAWGWRALHEVAASEGVVATAYEREHGPWSRAYQSALLYLYHPSSALASCPLAMTDGAARVLETLAPAAIRDAFLPRLTSRDPGSFWTAGQWMTERTGGSDVSGTATVAKPEGDHFRLYGNKWFTSATTAEMALTLARDESLPEPALSLFLLEVRKEDGSFNHIVVNRLKDKLGTRALPTAELELEGTLAVRLGEPGKGVKNISTVLNITRLYNSVSAAGYMRRGIALALDYATRRSAFGKQLEDLPLHAETLRDLQAEHAAALYLVMNLAVLMGHEEAGVANSRQQALLRLMTPLVKLYTGKQAVSVASEVLECFGGAGYVEDTGLPELLRDCQVLSIWEGTTNVLSLDVLRALQKGDVFEIFLADADERIQGLQEPLLAAIRPKLTEAVNHIRGYYPSAVAAGPDVLQAGARRFAYSLARTYAAILLAESAKREATSGGGLITSLLLRWCRQSLAPLLSAEEIASGLR